MDLIKKSKQVAKNSSFLFFGNIFHKAGMLIFTSIAARKLGADFFGIFSLAQVLSGLVRPLADPGISKIMYRDAAEDPDLVHSLLGAGLILRLFLICVAFGFLLLLSKILGYSRDVTYIIAIVGAGVLILDLTKNYNSIFNALAKSHLVSLSDILRTFILLIIVLLLKNLNLDIHDISWAYLAKALIMLIIVNIISKVYGFNHLIPEKQFVKKVLKRGLPLGVQAFTVYLYLNADSVMLSTFLNMGSVGYYQAAYRLVSSLNIIGSAITTAIFPVFTKLIGNDERQLGQVFYRATKYLMFVGVGIAAGTVALAPRIISLIYGSQYNSSIRPLQILVWAEALIFVSFVAYQLLLALDHRMTILWQGILAAVLNILMNILAIRYWKINGAAVTTLLTEIFVLGFMLWHIHSSGIVFKLNWIYDVVRLAFASVAMFTLLLFLKGLSIWISIPLGGGFFITILFFVRYFDKFDVRVLRSILIEANIQ